MKHHYKELKHMHTIIISMTVSFHFMLCADRDISFLSMQPVHVQLVIFLEKFS